MAIDGRINVDVLFHDTDGTTSLKVVSLEDAAAYTSGKVAIVTGTCGTSATTITLASIGSTDAAGNPVSMSSVSRLAFQATPGASARAKWTVGTRIEEVASVNNEAACTSIRDGTAYSTIEVLTYTGTASYTLVLYGT